MRKMRKRRSEWAEASQCLQTTPDCTAGMIPQFRPAHGPLVSWDHSSGRRGACCCCTFRLLNVGECRVRVGIRLCLCCCFWSGFSRIGCAVLCDFLFQVQLRHREVRVSGRRVLVTLLRYRPSRGGVVRFERHNWINCCKFGGLQSPSKSLSVPKAPPRPLDRQNYLNRVIGEICRSGADTVGLTWVLGPQESKIESHGRLRTDRERGGLTILRYPSKN